jgi:hypothetical protein
MVKAQGKRPSQHADEARKARNTPDEGAVKELEELQKHFKAIFQSQHGAYLQTVLNKIVEHGLSVTANSRDILEVRFGAGMVKVATELLSLASLDNPQAESTYLARLYLGQVAIGKAPINSTD